MRPTQLANPRQGAQPGQRQDVALGMAAAEPQCPQRQPCQQSDGERVVAARRKRSRRGTPSGRGGASSRRGACAARGPRRGPARDARRAPESPAPTKASIACRSLKLQNASSLNGAHASATTRQRVPGSTPRRVKTPEQRRGVDQIGDAGVRTWADALVVQRQGVDRPRRTRDGTAPDARSNAGRRCCRRPSRRRSPSSSERRLRRARSSRRHAPWRGARARCAGRARARPVRSSSARSYSPRLLQAEGMHRQHRAVTGQVARPRRQHGGDTVAHPGDVAGDVVERVRHLEREDVARLDAAGACRAGPSRAS